MKRDILHPRIYLDHAATTPLRTEVADAMRAALDEEPTFNPSSLHHAEGRRARARLDDARNRVAAALGVSRKEVTFTGGGTESDNLALAGAVRAMGKKGRIVASAIEHHAVLHSLDALADEGFEICLIPVNGEGRVDPGAFEAALVPGTLLASIMYANNEIGTVQPVAELAQIARRRGVTFHTDAVQAPAWLPVRIPDLGADLVSISAHKFGGPRGVGAMLVRQGVAVQPVVRGGGQEFGRRSGTENVLGTAAMARALELAVTERPEAAVRIAALRDRLEAGILERVPEARVLGAGAPRMPNISSVAFAGLASEALLVRLDLDGVAVSAGSACTSGALEPSHVVAALGVPREWQTGVIRFSLGSGTTAQEIDRVLELLPAAVWDIRGSKGDTTPVGRLQDA